MLTYQDYELASAEGRVREFMGRAIREHQRSSLYATAVLADRYDHRENVTVRNVMRLYQDAYGNKLADTTAANHHICSNFFHRLNTQRCTYSLGNGVTFNVKELRDGAEVDAIRARLGPRFDTDLMHWGYKALIHGVAFGFWNLDRLYVFPVTEFAPLWDEEDGTLRAGIRFWQLDRDKPMTAVLYTEAGYAVYKSVRAGGGALDLAEAAAERPYKLIVTQTPADGARVVGFENYGALPIVPLWGSGLRQSTLIGLREQIDSYDLIRSGFANDLEDCAQIYWIIQNCGGMSDRDLQAFLERLRHNHVAQVDTHAFDGDVRGALTPYAQEVPYAAREAYLSGIRADIYEHFGGLDVHSIAAGSTNDHIDAAYQPLDEEADDFEEQVIEAVQQVLRLIGYEDVPSFKRNRVSNVKEQIEAVMLEAAVLDDEALLGLLPNVTTDMRDAILARRSGEGRKRALGIAPRT